MTKLQGESIEVELPAGWEGRIASRNGGSGPRGSASIDASNGRSARLHAANFALPPDVADFGGGAVELMGNRDLLVILFEYDAASASTPLFASKGIPRIGVDDFDPYALQQVLRRFRTVPVVNDVLAATRIS
jgi:hypothetical protein